MGFIGQAANAFANARKGARDIQDANDERQQRQFQTAALLAGLRDQGIIPAGEMERAPAQEAVPVTPSKTGVQIASINVPNVTPGRVDQSRYESLGKTGMVRDRSTSINMTPRAQFQRNVLALKRLHPDLPIEQVVAIAQDKEALASYLKAEPPRNIDPLSPQGIEASGKRAAVEAQARPANIDPLSESGITASAKRAGAVAAAEAPYRPKKAANGRAIPSSAVEKLVGLDNMLSMAKDVQKTLIDAIKDKVNVSGRVGGVIATPTWSKNLVGMGGDRGADARALIGNLYGLVAKERGGTALSASELRLLESYLPNENEPETTALIKAGRFIRTLNQMRENKLKAYGKYGYGTGGVIDDEAPTADRIEQNLPHKEY